MRWERDTPEAETVAAPVDALLAICDDLVARHGEAGAGVFRTMLFRANDIIEQARLERRVTPVTRRSFAPGVPAV